MKVVRIIARLNVGGPAKHVAWLASRLRGAGVETVLVAGVVPAGEDDMTYFASAQGVTPVIIPEMSREISLKDAVTVWKLYRLMRRERPDIVHTHTAKAGTVGRVAGLLYRWLTPSVLFGRPRACRFVHTYHGHIFHSYYGKWKTRLFLLIEQTLARVATDRIIVISPQQFREIHEEFGVGRREQFVVIPLGLDTSAFADWESGRAAARGKLNAGEREVLVGIVGRLTEIKNHRLFLEAAARDKAAREGDATQQEDDTWRVRFVIVGDGHLRAELESYTRSLGLAEDVVFTGLRDDPENFYPALDVVALTSLNEGTPLTLIEAMANARPVISTDVGGVADLLGTPDTSKHDGRASGWRVCERGVLVEGHDAETFSRALRYLIVNDELRATLGERGREFVAQRYSVERLTADILKLYEEMLDSAGVREAQPAGTNRNISRVGGAAHLKGD
ncbi:MAG: glycosyltransferase [Pyrinomonadaceae bacterium]